MLGRDRLAPVRQFLTGALPNTTLPGKAQKPSLAHGIAIGIRQYGQARV